MKKMILAFTATIITAAALHAQTTDATKTDLKQLKSEDKSIKKQEKKDKITLRKLEGKDVAYESKQNFITDFNNITDVKWVRGSFYDEASFSKDGQQETAYYGPDSKLVGTVIQKKFEDLSADAQKHIKSHYKDYTIDRVVLFDDNEDNDMDMVMYGNQFDDQDNYFVELTKDAKTIVLQVAMNGETGYFTKIR